MNTDDIKKLKSFYQKQLKENILSFWLPRCVDIDNGGFFNCFDNSGKNLVSKDKYTWSQGRFVWIWSKLSCMEGDTFCTLEKDYFLQLARHGRDFLYKHCLLGEYPWSCVFLMDEKGNPKYAEGTNFLDSSIFADCFVAAGFALYSRVTKSIETWNFTKMLYDSILYRIKNNLFNSLPYPLGKDYRMHSIPMILTNLSCEMYRAAKSIEPLLSCKFINEIDYFSSDILNNFVDSNNVLREIISSENSFINGILGDHINPGHIIEDMWFQLDASDILHDTQRFNQIIEIANNAYELGWDDLQGGYFHFVRSDGSNINGTFTNDTCNEPQLKQVYEDWDSKLWWVHSEALYTSLLIYFRTKDTRFLSHYYKTAEYIFDTFPNTDSSIGEWQQIRTRAGVPQDKVVALPVKDPYHIIRNFILIIELLENELTLEQ